MKYKRFSYLLVLILMLMLGINRTYADIVEECNYLSDGKISMARLEVKDGSGFSLSRKKYAEVYFQKLGNKVDDDSEPILNWYKEFKDDETGITLNAVYDGKDAAKNNASCPEYLIVRTNNKYSSYGAFATDSILIAEKFVEESNNTGEFKTWYLTYKNADGSKITDEQYYGSFVTTDTIIDKDAKLTCTQFFGDKDDDGDKNDINSDGTASIAYMIDSVLQYVRIIVPILIILLGSLDLAKAVIAGKEEQMKKAQTTFIKRVILGLVVFFVPLLVDVVMWLADIVWDGLGYSVCEFK